MGPAVCKKPCADKPAVVRLSKSNFLHPLNEDLRKGELFCTRLDCWFAAGATFACNPRSRSVLLQ